jgi:hypothetical protein
MSISVHENQTIKNADMRVEEHVFRNCKLVNCRLFYDGGPFELANTSFENCQWGFRGPAQMTMVLLTVLGILKPGTVPMPPSGGGSSVN